MVGCFSLSVNICCRMDFENLDNKFKSVGR